MLSCTVVVRTVLKSQRQRHTITVHNGRIRVYAILKNSMDILAFLSKGADPADHISWGTKQSVGKAISPVKTVYVSFHSYGS